MRKTKEVVDAQAAADLDPGVAVAPVSSGVAIKMGEVTGEVDSSDVIMPKLQLVHGVGDLSETFNPGDLVLNREYFLAARGDKLKVVVLACTKYYKEYRVVYDPDAPPPKILATKKEVEDLVFTDSEGNERKGRTEYQDNPDGGRRLPPDYLAAATLILLIEKPDDLICPAFASEFNGKQYAPALMYTDKNAYSRSAKKVISAGQMELRGKGLTSRFFELHTGVEKLGGNSTNLPYLKLDNPTPEDLRDWVRVEFMGG